MSLSEISQEAVDATPDEDDDGGSGTDIPDYERADITDTAFVKPHPGMTAIGGTVTGLRYFAPAPEEDRKFDDNDRGWAGVILEDPFIPSDAENVSIFKSTTETGDDYKVVNVEDESVDVYDAGVSVGSMFESDQVEEFDDDKIILKTSTSAGRSIIRTLDVRGLANARMDRDDDGQVILNDAGYPEMNNALIETHPDNDDDNYTQPRYARHPQLRPDVEGEEITIILEHLSDVQEDYDGNAHWATVMASLDDDSTEELSNQYADDPYLDPEEASDFINEVDGTEMLRLAPTMDFAPDTNLLRATQYLEWHWLPEDELEALQEEQGVTPS